jgi:hypothetical protein
MDLGGVLVHAAATLENDGIRFAYTITNRTSTHYDKIQAITDPRMQSDQLRDVRLERTYVHYPTGFALMAAETPKRLTMKESEWLPLRYRVSFRWPVDAWRTQKQPDKVTWYSASRAADEPMIATLSKDAQWVVATFSKRPGNLWTNPELTCQHADPEAPLLPHQTVVLEEKTLILRGTLADALRYERSERATLQP